MAKAKKKKGPGGRPPMREKDKCIKVSVSVSPDLYRDGRAFGSMSRFVNHLYELATTDEQ